MGIVAWNVTGFVENAVHRQIGDGHSGVIDGNEHEMIHGSALFGKLLAVGQIAEDNKCNLVFVIVEAFVFPWHILVVKVMSKVSGWCRAINNQQE